MSIFIVTHIVYQVERCIPLCTTLHISDPSAFRMHHSTFCLHCSHPHSACNILAAQIFAIGAMEDLSDVEVSSLAEPEPAEAVSADDVLQQLAGGESETHLQASGHDLDSLLSDVEPDRGAFDDLSEGEVESGGLHISEPQEDVYHMQNTGQWHQYRVSRIAADLSRILPGKANNSKRHNLKWQLQRNAARQTKTASLARRQLEVISKVLPCPSHLALPIAFRPALRISHVHLLAGGWLL